MSSSPASLSFVLPFYNEDAVVDDVVGDTLAVLNGLERETGLILVDDGSEDATGERVTALAAEHGSVRTVRHPANKGYGRALISGFNAAEKDLVGYMDGDGQFDPAEIERFLDTITDVDVAVGYRTERQDAAARRAVGSGFNRVARAVLPVTVRDIDCGFKLMRREVLDTITLETRRTVDAELLAKANAYGFSITEIPVTHSPRTDGVSEAAGLFGVRIPLVLKTLQELWMIRRDLP